MFQLQKHSPVAVLRDRVLVMGILLNNRNAVLNRDDILPYRVKENEKAFERQGEEIEEKRYRNMN